ncbi:Por secretion system C-terminal sorting domain-containing protein [Mesonia phycicola]|uniref:Por secretion system C-terminal sorting domain-containing protein n=1 Tax=Mesonia phycicola TaxID=579105 RepID=A0A1M6HA06_9FLAO|nr:T9SS type A sorting domain-containing protein [Mesonia phycicola]SHJ18953.1 Por secretion system C-terminal sorting domain-containing protein [Mesonia phycicola]
MKNKINYLFAILLLMFQIQITMAQTTFEWETATDNGDNVTETIDGITATFSGLPDLTITNCGGCFGSSNNLVVSDGTNNGMSVTFAFSETVNVNTILAIDGNGANIDYTFTPTGGNNSIVVASLTNGSASVDLNWTDVTSFTVTSSGSLFGFDNLFINGQLSNTDFNSNNIVFYPNPVQDILYLKNIDNLEAVSLYNNLGQRILEIKGDKIDLSNFDIGTYFLKIKTSDGIKTTTILKK